MQPERSINSSGHRCHYQYVTIGSNLEPYKISIGLFTLVYARRRIEVMLSITMGYRSVTCCIQFNLTAEVC